MKVLTVKQLRDALANVDDDVEVILSSDTGVDQGEEGPIVVESARLTAYGNVTVFEIYANEIIDED